MPFRTRWSLLGLASILALSGATAPSPEMEILRRAAAHYRDASTTWLEGTVTAEFRGSSGPRTSEATFRLALAPGGRSHDELAHPSAGGKRVSDGTNTWFYVASLNQYSRQPVAEKSDDLGQDGMATMVLVMLRSLDRDVESVRVLPDESVLYQGEERPCHVLQVVHEQTPGLALPKAPRIFWIDRERGVVLKQFTAVAPKAPPGSTPVEQRETLLYTKVVLGGALPESLFTFRPPPGAKRVEEFAMPNADPDNLTGRTAADFTLADLGGRKHSLRGQRGKVVMLDFWASWCGPCRIQMPMVEKLHHELKDKGLVVYAINQGEAPETARRYLTRNQYSATTLLDPATEVGRTYNVAGIPTLVIIDRKGKIAAHYVGVRSEAVLRDALRRAGL